MLHSAVLSMIGLRDIAGWYSATRSVYVRRIYTEQFECLYMNLLQPSWSHAICEHCSSRSACALSQSGIGATLPEDKSSTTHFSVQWSSRVRERKCAWWPGSTLSTYGLILFVCMKLKAFYFLDTQHDMISATSCENRSSDLCRQSSSRSVCASEQSDLRATLSTNL